MACNCSNYACLDVVRAFNSCPTILTLVLPSTFTGEMPWEFEFNGLWKGGTIDVTTGENIVLPWVFNEYYNHLIKFYNTDGTLFNNTCYRLDTAAIPGSYTSPSSGTSSVNSITFTVTSGMLSNGGATITNAAIAARTIILIADGTQIYNSGGFTQTEGSNSFTMTNRARYKAGQVVTLLFEA